MTDMEHEPTNTRINLATGDMTFEMPREVVDEVNAGEDDETDKVTLDPRALDQLQMDLTSQALPAFIDPTAASRLKPRKIEVQRLSVVICPDHGVVGMRKDPKLAEAVKVSHIDWHKGHEKRVLDALGRAQEVRAAGNPPMTPEAKKFAEERDLQCPDCHVVRDDWVDLEETDIQACPHCNSTKFPPAGLKKWKERFDARRK